MLFGGNNDPWAPESVMEEMKDLVEKKSGGVGGVERSNMSVTYDPRLKHDYVMDPNVSVPIVVNFIVDQVLLLWSSQQYQKAAAPSQLRRAKSDNVVVTNSATATTTPLRSKL